MIEAMTARALVLATCGPLFQLAACGPMSQQPAGSESTPAAPPYEGAAPSAATDPWGQPEAPVRDDRADVPAAPAASDRTFAQRFVDAHNRYRAQHCAPPLAWSEEVAKVAQAWANTLRDRGCTFEHSPGGRYGENLAAGTQGALDPERVVAMWYDEVADYSFSSGGFSMSTGHFTQVVWRSTRSLGCGHVTCKGNDIYVCNYDPPGNWQGRYREEVLPTSCAK